ncbi:hypothetical protein [Mesorhizobium sp.]|uniref:hypothetical protein n=1 Tax=Mesorhizobium sp. TaxID=1871066 RepID=UPI00121B9490|nr:hypothetical protein [Mesorhizobium sp.]TIV60724.1 MAG: DUF4365 domain-containing protein [Mesorhizobium sp.]
MKIGKSDDFENLYLAKFRLLAAPHGEFVEYIRDRAGRDIGLHLTQTTQPQAGKGKTQHSKIVTPALIWFQMKGLMNETLGIETYEATQEVSVRLETAHLRFWYMNIQPTYLCVYIECADCFLAMDIKEWTRREYGEAILTDPRKTITVKVHKRNVLDDQFFRLVLERNLVPALRSALANDDDRQIARFLRDSSIVKWLASCARSGAEARITVIKWMSKMRTEVYFDSRKSGGKWESVRTHWQFAMGEITEAFPYLSFKPKRKAERLDMVEVDNTDEGEERYVTSTISLVEDEDDDGDWWDYYEEIDRECLLSIGEDEYSYGTMQGGERIVHEININLNQVGQRWAATLEILEKAEIISVDIAPHWISVAPWHARDV